LLKRARFGELIAAAPRGSSLEIFFEKAGMPDRSILHAELAAISRGKARLLPTRV
jgi:hypothetical protein